MKKALLFTFSTFLYYFTSYAQTNIFPASGNVGIGTTTPFEGLSWANPGIEVSGARGTVGLTTKMPGGIATMRFKGPTSGSEMHWNFIDGSTPNLMLYSYSGGEYLLTLKGNGKVGMGTTEPEYKLHLNSTKSSSQLGITGSEYGGMLSALTYAPDNVSVGFDVAFSNGGWVAKHNSVAWLYKVDNRLRVQGSTGNTVGNAAVQNDLFSIDLGTGNIGIGTTTPTEKLSVNGKIRAKEIKVETSNWPDYVFKGDYKPTSLQETEAFIKIHKHLPEIPSAKEAEEHGISLGEMNTKLLKKIEELTLHLIEQNKELKVQSQKLEEQEQKIEAQHKRLQQLEAHGSPSSP